LQHVRARRNATFFIFDLATISVDDETVRDTLGLPGVFLCLLDDGTASGDAQTVWPPREPHLLLLPHCTLAQEVRTADAYEVVQDAPALSTNIRDACL
jgi:hypothetical protein